MVHKLPQIYTANHVTSPIQKRKITVQICDNFWVTQYSWIYETTPPHIIIAHIRTLKLYENKKEQGITQKGTAKSSRAILYKLPKNKLKMGVLGYIPTSFIQPI